MAELEGISVLFPIMGECGNAAQWLEPWLSVLAGLNRPYEVLLLADPQTTNAQPLEAIAAKNPRCRVHVVAKPGYGACIALGLAESRMPLVFYSALNEGWNPADLPRMLQSIAFKDEYSGKTVDVVNGHRRGITEPSGRAWRRQLFGVFMRVVYGVWPDAGKGYLGPAETRYWYRARLQFGLRFGDPNSRFKLFRKHVFDRIEVQSTGEFIHTELLAKINFLGALMDELALTDRCTPGALPDMAADRVAVFQQPKFRSPPADPEQRATHRR